MSRGYAERVKLDGVRDLGEFIGSRKPFQALSGGALRPDLPNNCRVTTRNELRDGLIAHTKEFIDYRKGQPAFGLLDYDQKGMPPKVAKAIARRGGFWQAMLDVLPALKNAARVERKSTSAGIYNSATGEKFPDSGGLHVYIAAKDGADIPRFLNALHVRCWLAGYGWDMVGGGGSLLERSIIDRSVGSPERIIFEGNPVVVRPLKQDTQGRRPIVIDGEMIDTLAVCPSPTAAELAAFGKMKQAEKARLKPEVAKAIKVAVARVVERGVSNKEAQRIVKRKNKGVLLSSVALHFYDREFGECTVGDVLDDPERFEDQALADPVEGVGYGRQTAKVFIRDGVPRINSFAHNGIQYQLKYTAADLEKVDDTASFYAKAIVADISKREQDRLIAALAKKIGVDRVTLASGLDDARKNGVLHRAQPTYAAHEELDIAKVRKRIRKRLLKILTSTSPDAVSALWIDTGIGKTKIIIEVLSELIKSGKIKRTVVYAVPGHKLGQRIDQQFAAHGISARVFRGREQKDPETPGKEMCLNLPAVNLALECHADVSTSCCKKGKMRCRFFERCGYQRQTRGDKPQVWIVAGDILFHGNKVFGDVECVIIDEAIWNKGVHGLDSKNKIEIPIDSFVRPKDNAFIFHENNRAALGEALMKQKNDGNVERRHLSDYATLDLNRTISAEWSHYTETEKKLQLYPGMSDAAFMRSAARNMLIYEMKLARRMIKVWEAVRFMMADPTIKVSGNLVLKQHKRRRVLEWRGVREISARFKVKTVMLDATLPDLSILRIFHPQAKIVDNIKAAMPASVRIRQILKSPTSASKLIRKDIDNKRLKEIRRYILRRWMETGRQPSLVICQMEFEEKLRGIKLPEGIKLAHYNAVAGIDDYKDVRLLILVGRTAPGHEAMQEIAGALSGRQPILLKPNDGGFIWYDKITRGIRLADGTGIKVIGDQHPDPLVEAVRWQIHEGQLIQALGRARGVNRTADTPLDVDLLFDSCLPIAVDEVTNWKSPSRLIDIAFDEGVILTAPGDLTKVWPAIWQNSQAAKRTLQVGIPALPGMILVSYQLVGPKMNMRKAYFDPAIVPDPRAWIEAKLGQIAKFSR